MINILQNANLLEYNTFRVNCNAKKIFTYTDTPELIEFIKQNRSEKFLPIGDGSNILFANDYFDGIIVKSKATKIEIIDENEDFLTIRAEAGVNWDEFVKFAVENNWGGIENLSLIPGTIGAAPVQNIGAYGMEVAESIKEVEWINLENEQEQILDKENCKFAYRNSIFKNELKNKAIITAVKFILSKKPIFKINYSELKKELESYNLLNLQIIRNSIIKIRQNKLPDHNIIPNAGSFFKNPIISINKANELKHIYKDIAIYNLPDKEKVKISAAYIIEKAGCKNIETNGVATYHKHSLIVINKSTQKGLDIINFANEIKEKVKEKFEIELEFEVNIY